MVVEQAGANSPAQGKRMSPTEDAVREQLQSILMNPMFKRKPMLGNLLRFLVEETLAGNTLEIKEYTVAIRAFGRKDNFDPSRDPIVRVQAGRLRRALEQYYQNHGRGDPVRIDIPKGAYVPIFREIPTMGTPAERGSAAEERPALSRAVGPAIAVMPLLNLTGDPEQEFFVDGLTEEMAGELARYQDFRVIASHSTMKWKGRKLGAREVGESLGVEFFLEGSMRKDADNMKIAARLISTSDRMQVWGEEYRCELSAKNLIALQEEIARKVAAKIGGLYGIIPRLLSGEARRKPPDSLKTYEAYLRFYHCQTTLSAEDHVHTLRALESAVARDPGCGLAWSMLASLHANSCTLGFSREEGLLERALSFARKGASLEPENQLARAILAYVHFITGGRELFLREAERAMALNPNAAALIAFLGWQMALFGQSERGLDLLRRGIELNPYYPGWFHMAPCLYLYHQGDYEEAFGEAGEFQMPHLFWDPLLRTCALGQLGREREAAASARELLALRPDFCERGRELIGYYVKPPDLVDAVLAGLRKAGMDV